MKKTMTQYEIAHELLQDTNANWSRAGAFALAEYFEQIEMDTNEELDFDAVAIRCDFSEYESLQDWAHDYFTDAVEEMGFTQTEEIDDNDFNEKIREYVQYHGQLIEFDGGVIVSQF
jgi:hypothetical protein